MYKFDVLKNVILTNNSLCVLKCKAWNNKLSSVILLLLMRWDSIQNIVYQKKCKWTFRYGTKSFQPNGCQGTRSTVNVLQCSICIQVRIHYLRNYFRNKLRIVMLGTNYCIKQYPWMEGQLKHTKGKINTFQLYNHITVGMET